VLCLFCACGCCNGYGAMEFRGLWVGVCGFGLAVLFGYVSLGGVWVGMLGGLCGLCGLICWLFWCAICFTFMWFFGLVVWVILVVGGWCVLVVFTRGVLIFGCDVWLGFGDD